MNGGKGAAMRCVRQVPATRIVVEEVEREGGRHGAAECDEMGDSDVV